VLQLVDCSLRQANMTAKLGLTPIEHGPHDADLGGKSLPSADTQITRPRIEMC
jgi:hypothetical protein